MDFVPCHVCHRLITVLHTLRSTLHKYPGTYLGTVACQQSASERSVEMTHPPRNGAFAKMECVLPTLIALITCHLVLSSFSPKMNKDGFILGSGRIDGAPSDMINESGRSASDELISHQLTYMITLPKYTTCQSSFLAPDLINQHQ